MLVTLKISNKENTSAFNVIISSNNIKEIYGAITPSGKFSVVVETEDAQYPALYDTEQEARDYIYLIINAIETNIDNNKQIAANYHFEGISRNKEKCDNFPVSEVNKRLLDELKKSIA